MEMPCSRNELGFFEKQKHPESLDGVSSGVSEVRLDRWAGPDYGSQGSSLDSL